jgi:hypothetical protein
MFINTVYIIGEKGKTIAKFRGTLTHTLVTKAPKSCPSTLPPFQHNTKLLFVTT